MPNKIFLFEKVYRYIIIPSLNILFSSEATPWTLISVCLSGLGGNVIFSTPNWDRASLLMDVVILVLGILLIFVIPTRWSQMQMDNVTFLIQQSTQSNLKYHFWNVIMYKNLYSLMMTFENAISHTCCAELDILIIAPLPLPRAQLILKVARHRAIL